MYFLVSGLHELAGIAGGGGSFASGGDAFSKRYNKKAKRAKKT